MVESRSVRRNAKNARGLERDRAAFFPPPPPPFPSRARLNFAFNTSPLRILSESLAQAIFVDTTGESKLFAKFESDIVWHKIFVSFAIFPAICKNKSPQIKITANIFAQKNLLPSKILIFLNLNSLHKNTVLRYHVCSITTCLFHSETKRYTMKYWFYIGYMHTVVLFENMYFYSTYSIKTKILSMLGTGYFLKIAKINSQQEMPISPNHKN